ncbi:MAG: beta-ketoacyl-ACP synthase III [Acidimicrobiales bacterium]
MPGAITTGWGVGLPANIVTNADLESRLDTSDAWITERTGIKQRHIGGTTSELAIMAGKEAMKSAGVLPEDIDILLLATTTPDERVPGTSATVQNALGIAGGAFDLNAACSGFVYSLVVAHGLISVGAKRILVIGSETLSSITNMNERTLAVVIGDGAAGIVLERTEGSGELLAWDLGADGSLRHLLYCEHGGYLFMDGKEVFRRAVRIIVDSAQKALSKAGFTSTDVDLFVPHQANARIVEAARGRLGIPTEKAMVTIDRYGNTSSSSIPLALVAALHEGRLKKGDLVLLSGFGAGMTWGSALLRFGG